jgi:hypothetical protein
MDFRLGWAVVLSIIVRGGDFYVVVLWLSQVRRQIIEPALG